jgi:hypothetical protein
MEKYPENKSSRNLLVGLIFLLAGVGLFARQLDLPIPHWIFSWEIFLIALGFFVGMRSGFQGPGWFIMILIGSIFLTEDLIPGLEWHNYMWPLALVVIGIFLIMRPRRRDWSQWGDKANYGIQDGDRLSNEDYIDQTAIFGSIKRNILSKDFKGGEVTSIFGGSEINLLQADIQGRVVLEATSIFGGTHLKIPANWEVKSEITAILGGMEDKRPLQAPSDPSKVLILKGTTIFGGLEITSY